MKSNTFSKIVLGMVLTIASVNIQAQQNLTLYNMESIPQRMYTNPAHTPDANLFISGLTLPGLGSQYINVGNSGFVWSDLRAENSDALDFPNVLSKLKENNYLTLAYQPDLVSFGFKVQKNYFTFNLTEKVNVRFNYPKDFMSFLIEGNAVNLGEEKKFNVGLDASHYREFGFGYSREIDEKLTVGGKFKYLYGLENIHTKTTDVSITTDATDFSLLLKGNIEINSSGLNNASTDNYVAGRKNNGFGVDLGGSYKIDDKITVNASVIDLGMISWKNDATTFQSKNPNAVFSYDGLELQELLDTAANPTQDLLDTLGDVFDVEEVTKTYKTALASQVYLGGTYEIKEGMTGGAVFYSQIYDKSIKPALALSFNHKVGKWLNYAVSYSAFNRSYANIGLGVGLSLGPMQLYMVTDNILAIAPQNVKNIHLHMGMNLVMGRAAKKDKAGASMKDGGKKDKSDKSKSDDKKEPTDKDNDKIMDAEDQCPNDSGSVEMKGCPDMDGDKVADKDDACPKEFGLPEFKGCPDSDGDGIPDKSDDCPEEQGTEALKGCPDRDGDGIKDSDDKCPDEPGTADNDGCATTTLQLIDSTGNVIKETSMRKDGSFKFDSLPEGATFKVLNGKADGTQEYKVVVGGVPRKVVLDKTDSKGLFKLQ